jgi:hypothetical protein
MYVNYNIVKLAYNRYNIKLKAINKDKRAYKACFIRKSKKRIKKTLFTLLTKPLQIIYINTLTYIPVNYTGFIYNTTFINGYISYY